MVIPQLTPEFLSHRQIARALVVVAQHLGANPMRIAGLGCGNARIVQAIRDTKLLYEYTGFDLNEACLETARRPYPEHKFESLDLDHLVSGSLGHYDGVVLDSTLSMVEDPRRLLISLLERSRAIVVGRVKWGTTTERGEYLWSGMTSPSVNWQFNKEFFDEVADETDGVSWIFEQSCVVLLAPSASAEGNEIK